MKQSDCYHLGEVIKTHGLKGEVSISLDVDFPEKYSELESVFLEQQGKLVPFFIETLQINGNKALVKFEEVHSIEDASALVKCPLHLPLTFLPALPDGGYYFHDLVDCMVMEESREIGKVKEVIDLSGNQLLVVQQEEKEHLIPLMDEILEEVIVKDKLIKVNLPDGLLDINS